MAVASGWRGNLLRLDPGPSARGGRRVAFLEIATGDFVVLEENLAQEFGEMMPRGWPDLLLLDQYEQWLATGGRPVGPNECVSPHELPALGGDPDDVSNWLTIDLMVAVSIAGQLHEQTRNLPAGHRITEVRVVPR